MVSLTKGENMFTPDALILEKHENTNEQRKLVSGFPITAIVVEHETISRVILAAVLSCDGYRVFQTDNPITAISYFRTNDPALLIVDLDMPEWTYIVQFALDRRPNTFVIGMVENNPMPDVSDLNRCGIGVCWQKPVLYDNLRRTLSDYVHGRRVA
jgi:DNA-binding NtrC family response regulator